MLKIPIKAGQITNLTDARYFAARGVKWLSFYLKDTHQFTKQLQEVKAIKEWIEGPILLVELDLNTRDTLEVMNYLELDAIQLTKHAHLEQVEELKDFILFKEVVFSSENTIQNLFANEKPFANYVNYFVFNFKKAGLCWEDMNAKQKAELKAVCENFPVILHIDIDPENLNELLNEIEIEALELIGGEEEKVGVKSFEELDEILEALENL